MKSTGLGQGVNLLFGDDLESNDEKYFECDIDKIRPNKYQPRRAFDEKDLQELTDSILENGIIQPLIVNLSKDEGWYDLIAGERRLRASKLAGLATVPVVVYEINNEDSLLELALVENIQRKDLNPIEEAEAYNKLIKKFGYTQEQTAKRVGKKRSTITNILRLLNLPDSLKDDVIQGTLSEGHARCLLRLNDDVSAIESVRGEIFEKKLSVRQTEALVKKRLAGPAVLKSTVIDEETVQIPKERSTALSSRLTKKLLSKVSIHQKGDRGKIVINYSSLDDLERVIGLIIGNR